MLNQLLREVMSKIKQVDTIRLFRQNGRQHIFVKFIYCGKYMYIIDVINYTNSSGEFIAEINCENHDITIVVDIPRVQLDIFGKKDEIRFGFTN